MPQQERVRIAVVPPIQSALHTTLPPRSPPIQASPSTHATPTRLDAGSSRVQARAAHMPVNLSFSSSYDASLKYSLRFKTICGSRIQPRHTSVRKKGLSRLLRHDVFCRQAPEAK